MTLALRLVALTAVLFGGPTTLSAHKREPERALVVQVDREGLVVLWHARVFGKAAGLLLSTFDADGSGALDDDEARRLATTVLVKAMRGTQVSWEGETYAVDRLDARLEGDRSRGASKLSAIGLAKLRGGELGPRGTLDVRVDSGMAVSIMVQGLDPWRVVAAGPGRVAIDPNGLIEAVLVESGGRLQVSMESDDGGKSH